MNKLIICCLTFGLSLFAAETAVKAAFQASNKSNIYHLPSCGSARKISPSNLITFLTKEEAQKKGYRPCKVCKP